MDRNAHPVSSSSADSRGERCAIDRLRPARSLAELLTVGWTRAWQFTPVPWLQRNTAERRGGANSWTWQWGIVAVLAVWMLPLQVFAAARQADEIWINDGAAARITPVPDQPSTHHGQARLGSTTVQAAVAVVALILTLGPVAAIVGWAQPTSAELLPHWWIVLGSTWWIGALGLSIVTAYRTPRAARRRSLLHRAAQLSLQHGRGYVVTDVAARRRGTGAGRRLMLDLQASWTHTSGAAVLYAETADLAEHFYAPLGWRTERVGEDQLLVWKPPPVS